MLQSTDGTKEKLREEFTIDYVAVAVALLCLLSRRRQQQQQQQQQQRRRTAADNDDDDDDDDNNTNQHHRYDRAHGQALFSDAQRAAIPQLKAALKAAVDSGLFRGDDYLVEDSRDLVEKVDERFARQRAKDAYAALKAVYAEQDDAHSEGNGNYEALRVRACVRARVRTCVCACVRALRVCMRALFEA